VGRGWGKVLYPWEEGLSLEVSPTGKPENKDF